MSNRVKLKARGLYFKPIEVKSTIIHISRKIVRDHS
jgi:hypothetical protein